MKKLTQLFVMTIAMTVATSIFATSSEAAPVRLRKVSRLTTPQELHTQEVIKEMKKEIETRCSALSHSDVVEILSEKIVDVTPYGGRFVETGRIKCPDTDLPCNPVQGYIVDQVQLRDLEVTLVRRSGGQRYHIKAKTHWGFDLPVPLPYVELESRYCR